MRRNSVEMGKHGSEKSSPLKNWCFHCPSSRFLGGFSRCNSRYSFRFCFLFVHPLQWGSAHTG